MRRFLLLILAIPLVIYGFYLIYINSVQETLRKNRLEKALSNPLYLNLEDSSRSVLPTDLGITYSKESDLINIDEAKLNEFIQSLEKEYDFLSKNTVISWEEYTFRVPNPDSKVTIDKTLFNSDEKIRVLFLDPPLKLKLITEPGNSSEIQKEETEKIAQDISKPLLIKYGRNPIYIPQEIVHSFIKVKQFENSYEGQINKEEIKDYLDSLKTKYGSEDVVIVENEAVDAISRALIFRAADYQINNAVILPLEGKPRSNGELHDSYLEVIKSQQRLYRFENGELVKTYIVSTGLTWETPAGDFKVMGKQKMTISYFGNWYMPDYLPIGYVNGSYRFGFHAIPYHMDGAGNIFSRDINTMGSPATGGCIQLKPDEATELFEWAWVGLPVYVYE